MFSEILKISLIYLFMYFNIFKCICVIRTRERALCLGCALTWPLGFLRFKPPFTTCFYFEGHVFVSHSFACLFFHTRVRSAVLLLLQRRRRELQYICISGQNRSSSRVLPARGSQKLQQRKQTSAQAQ